MIDIKELNQKEHIGKPVLYRETPSSDPIIVKIIDWHEQAQLITVDFGGYEKTCYPQALSFPNPLPDVLEINLYAHCGEWAAYSKGVTAGLAEEAAKLFSYAGSEHEMTYEVVPTTGKALLIRVDGRELARPEGGN